MGSRSGEYLSIDISGETGKRPLRPTKTGLYGDLDLHTTNEYASSRCPVSFPRGRNRRARASATWSQPGSALPRPVALRGDSPTRAGRPCEAGARSRLGCQGCARRRGQLCPLRIGTPLVPAGLDRLPAPRVEPRRAASPSSPGWRRTTGEPGWPQDETIRLVEAGERTATRDHDGGPVDRRLPRPDLPLAATSCGLDPTWVTSSGRTGRSSQFRPCWTRHCPVQTIGTSRTTSATRTGRPATWRPSRCCFAGRRWASSRAGDRRLVVVSDPPSTVVDNCFTAVDGRMRGHGWSHLRSILATG